MNTNTPPAPAEQTASPTAPPLSHTVLDILGSPFVAIWTPEDEVVRAAGFCSASDVTDDELWHRLSARDPRLASRGLDSTPTSAGQIPAALAAYAAGETAAIDQLAVAQPETPFRGEVWRALRNMPAGSAVTYTELAVLAGRPAAVRAAASACAVNLVALIVPCHRIVRRDGGLGDYLFGVEMKRRLLAHEGASGVHSPLIW